MMPEMPSGPAMMPEMMPEGMPESMPSAEPTQITPEEIAGALEDLLKDARDEDRFVREDYVRLWKRLEYYWNNILDIFLDPVARDWRVPNWDTLEEEGEVAPRLINIYRPHGEAIVAALSVTVPNVFFHPDDADSPDDLEASKAYRTITELLALHNDAPMMICKAVVILFNQGTIFGYNYYHRDPKFGEYEKPKVEFKDIQIFEALCPQCGAGLDAGVVGNAQSQGQSPEGIPPEQQTQLPPQGGGPPLQSGGEQNNPQQSQAGPGGQQIGEPIYQCQECGYNGPAEINQSAEKLPQIVGFDKTAKGSVCQELFSGLHVKVPAYVRKQEECGYLLLEFTQSAAMLRSIYKDRADKINAQIDVDTASFSKIPLQYLGQFPDNAANVSCIWIRPYHYWQLGVGKREIIDHLTQNFPDGLYAIFINDEFMEVYPENMDEHWTISKNPLGQYIYGKPLGENLATVQDIRAQLVEIELQTAEHGIPETFADGKVLDFKKYGEGRARPGMVTQVNPRAGRSISDAFFTTKSAVLSQEIDPLRQHIDADAQFVVGSFPSVYGGPATGGSKTASEYSQSRANALQRLGTFWKIVSIFWGQFQARSAVEYANVLKELGKDERFTKREGQGFINLWIRASALSGKIGRVEPEATEQLPASWAQKKDAIQQLLMSGVEPIISVLTHPRNAEIMKEAIGLNELYIPGEENTMRQYKEFGIMSQGIPLPTNPLLDDDNIHAEVLKGILNGNVGDTLDPMIRQICEQHLMEHEQRIQEALQAEAEQQQSVNQSGSAAKSGKQPPADRGKQNVSTS